MDRFQSDLGDLALIAMERICAFMGVLAFLTYYKNLQYSPRENSKFHDGDGAHRNGSNSCVHHIDYINLGAHLITAVLEKGVQIFT